MWQIRQKFFSNNLYGAFLILLGGIITAGANSLTHSMSSDYSAAQILFLKSTIGWVFLCLLYGRKLHHILKTSILPYHALKGVFGAVGNWFWITALLFLPLAECSALSLTSAIITSIGGWMIFKERFYWSLFIASLLGFCGVYIILKPGWEIFSYYAIFPLISAIAFSGSSLMIKRLAVSDPSETTLFYLMCFMSVFSAVPAFYMWVPFENWDILKVCGIGFLYILTQLCIVEAYTHAAASFVAPFKFARFPFNVAIGFLFFMEVPAETTLLGAVIISGSYAYLYVFEKRRQRG